LSRTSPSSRKATPRQPASAPSPRSAMPSAAHPATPSAWTVDRAHPSPGIYALIGQTRAPRASRPGCGECRPRPRTGSRRRTRRGSRPTPSGWRQACAHRLAASAVDPRSWCWRSRARTRAERSTSRTRTRALGPASGRDTRTRLQQGAVAWAQVLTDTARGPAGDATNGSGPRARRDVRLGLATALAAPEVWTHGC